MQITYQRAIPNEAELLVHIYNKAFYDDYIKYGVCPGYGHSIENMRDSIEKNLKYTICVNQKAIGAISVNKRENGHYHIGCLCIVPEYQGLGIGTDAICFLQNELTDWKTFSLDTPADKTQNVKFYTEKCGFKIVDKLIDQTVELFLFQKERNVPKEIKSNEC